MVKTPAQHIQAAIVELQEAMVKMLDQSREQIMTDQVWTVTRELLTLVEALENRDLVPVVYPTEQGRDSNRKRTWQQRFGHGH